MHSKIRTLLALACSLSFACANTATTAEAPTANAGADLTGTTGSVVTLDGTASTDPAQLPLDWAWSFVSYPVGSTAVLANTDNPRASFTPNVAGAYVVRLVVRNKDKASTADEVTVTVTAGSPVARVADAVGEPGTRITLDARASTSPSGAPLTFAWTVTDPASAAVTDLLNATGATPSFVPLKSGRYAVSVTATDGTQTSPPATAQVLVGDLGRPVADAGADQRLKPNGTVALNGSASFTLNRDAIGQPRALTYTWSFASRPANSTSTLPAAGTSPTATFTADRAGTFIVKLVVNDGVADSTPDYVLVNADPTAPGRPPVVGLKALPATRVVFNDIVLDASDSTDPDGDTLRYSWSVSSAPSGANTTMNYDNDLPTAKFSTDVPGTYVITAYVYDNDDEVSQKVTVTVEGPTTLEVVAPILAASGAAGADQGTLKLRAKTATGVVIPHAPITWSSGVNTLTLAGGETDNAGDVTARVRLARTIGSTSVKAWVTGLKTASIQTVPFTITAGPVASINLQATNGATDTRSLVRVSTVDAFGNFVASASAGTFALSATSASGLATFANDVKNGTAGKGTLTGGGGTANITGTLESGEFEIELSDAKVEDVQLDLHLGPSSSAYPFSAWVVTDDGAEDGAGGWQESGSNRHWDVISGDANTGSKSYGVDILGGQVHDYSYSVFTRQLPVSAADHVRIAFRHKTLATPYPTSSNGCVAVPAFFVAMQSGDGYTNSREYPNLANGFDLASTCQNIPSFVGDGTTWRLETFDATEAFKAGNNRFALYMDNQGYYQYRLSSPVSLRVDDIKVEALSPPGFSATAPVGFRVGAPTKVEFTRAAFGAAPLLGQCVTSNSTTSAVNAEVRDALGNRVAISPTIKIKWTGTLTPAALFAGQLVGGISTNEITLKFVDGRARFTLAGPAQTVNLSLEDTGASGLNVAGVATSTVGGAYICHSTGIGPQWSDGVATGTFDETEAMSACESQYGVGQCGASATDAMPLYLSNCSYSYRWHFVDHGYTDTCSTSANLDAGKVSSFYFSTGSCSCSGPSGLMAPYRFSSANNWTWN